jgi:hypothetical protein
MSPVGFGLLIALLVGVTLAISRTMRPQPTA